MKRPPLSLYPLIALLCAHSLTAAPTPAESPAAEENADEQWKPKTHFKSPDERFSIDIQPIENAHTAGFNDQLLLLREGKKELARQTTFGFLLDVFWDDTGKYVAVNNRRGNGGDYIWIFTLPQGKCIKQADTNQFTFLTQSASAAFLKIDSHATAEKIDKFRFVAKGWWGSGPKLLVRIVTKFDYGRFDYHWFAYDAVVKIADAKFSLVSGEARKLSYVND